MLIPSGCSMRCAGSPSLSRRVNANSQLGDAVVVACAKLIKKGEC